MAARGGAGGPQAVELDADLDLVLLLVVPQARGEQRELGGARLGGQGEALELAVEAVGLEARGAQGVGEGEVLEAERDVGGDGDLGGTRSGGP